VGLFINANMNVNLNPKDATPEIEKLAAQETIKHAAIHELHRLHHESTIHHFNEGIKDNHLRNWKVLKYDTEQVPHGTNYFMKVHIDDGHNIHIRVHKQVHHDIYEFHTLHKTIKHNCETYVWDDHEPLTFFEA